MPTPTEDKLLLRNLRYEESGYPFNAEIWQTLHYAMGTNEVVRITTPKGALDNVWCPVEGCGSRPKDPNE
jgi:hypothetical protein